CLMRRLPRLIRPGDSQRIEISWFVGRIRRSRRIRHGQSGLCQQYEADFFRLFNPSTYTRKL
ncbi:hypothetical protein, partial [Escherichia coli]|uniref:hypothetical protein n=1 Tax=Escherichia coli TaxID=562 RepID=UPI001965513D